MKIEKNVRIKKDITIYDLANVIETIVPFIIRKDEDGITYTPYYKELGMNVGIAKYLIEGIEFEEDDDGEKVVKGGIVYKNEFICGCCGEVFSLKSKHCIKRLYVYNDWVDVSDQITGESVDELKIETE